MKPLSGGPEVRKSGGLITAMPIVWLTGIPGSGKTTLAQTVAGRLRAAGRGCLLIDGDVLRHDLSRDLGFSLADRAEQARRAAAVAAIAADQGLIALVALVSPYAAHRAAAYAALAPRPVLEVHVATPAAACAARDQRGLWTSAPLLTGRDAPYEAPQAPTLRLDLSYLDPEQAASMILNRLPDGFSPIPSADRDRSRP
jgi:adenylylsulfate kinase-like enzyme